MKESFEPAVLRKLTRILKTLPLEFFSAGISSGIIVP